MNYLFPTSAITHAAPNAAGYYDFPRLVEFQCGSYKAMLVVPANEDARCYMLDRKHLLFPADLTAGKRIEIVRSVALSQCVTEAI